MKKHLLMFLAAVMATTMSLNARTVLIDEGFENGIQESVWTQVFVSGEVLELNEELDAAPELVNNDPYGQGWIIKISVKDASELDKLMDAKAYQASL